MPALTISDEDLTLGLNIIKDVITKELKDIKSLELRWKNGYKVYFKSSSWI